MRSNACPASRVWTPHAATTVIGVTFLVMLLPVGAWAYTDVLAGLARGMAKSLIARSLLLVALLWPYAWLALPTMCACIGAALLLERAVAGHGVEEAVT